MSKVLMIGTGGCGNKILESFLTVLDDSFGLQSTYDGLYINSNVREMSKLNHYTKFNSLAIDGGGTGKSPKKCKEQLKASKSKLINHFNNVLPNYDYVTIISSSDGGWGNGSIFILANIIKQLNSDMPVNLVITIPPITSRRLSLENTLSLWEDILKLQGDMDNCNSEEERREVSKINSLICIDNDKMKNESEFNTKVAKLLLDSMELGNGSLDGNDVERVNSACGYKVVLELEDNKNIDNAIQDAIQDSPFVMPSDFYCTHLGAVVKEEVYNSDEPVNIFNPIDFDKCDYGDKNIIVLGGCINPTENVNILKEALDELDRENQSRTINRVKFTSNNKKTKPKKEEKEEKSNSVAKLRNTLSADFWND